MFVYFIDFFMNFPSKEYIEKNKNKSDIFNVVFFSLFLFLNYPFGFYPLNNDFLIHNCGASAMRKI